MGKKFVGKRPKKSVTKSERIEEQKQEIKNMDDVIEYMNFKDEKRKMFLERIENDTKRRKDKKGSITEVETTEEQIEKRAKMTAKRKDAQARQAIDRANLLKAMNKVDEER